VETCSLRLCGAQSGPGCDTHLACAKNADTYCGDCYNTNIGMSLLLGEVTCQACQHCCYSSPCCRCQRQSPRPSITASECCKQMPRKSILVLAAVYDDWMRVVQIYSGHMERKFVPVEKRGKGEADDDSKAPAESHPQSTGPHSANSDSIPTNGEHALCLVSWHTVQLLETGWYQRRHVVQSSYLT